MANNLTIESSKYGGRYLKVTCTQVSNGSVKNSSTINWEIESLDGNNDYYTTGPTKLLINGSTVYSKARVDWDDKVFPAKKGKVSGSIEVPHTNEGTKTIEVKFSTAIYTSTVSTYTKSWTLDSIPRLANITQSLKRKTETDISINWSTDSTIDALWYSKDDGTNWTSVDITEGTSGSYTITGLKNNTLYNVKTRVKRKDSQITSDSSRLQVETYDYPYCNKSPNFTVGEELTLEFFNPLKREITVSLIGDDESVLSTDIFSVDTITGYATENFLNKCYNSLPNKPSGNYKVSVTYENITSIRDNGNTYTLDLNLCKPNFSNFEYRDNNSSIVAVTGNNQFLIKDLSNLEVIISSANKMVAQKGATNKNYTLSIENVNKNVDYSGNDITVNMGAINNSGTKRLTVTAYDSRSNYKTVYKDLYIYSYAKPVVNVDISRLNNFESQTTIKISGTYDKLTIDGVDKNSITSVEYRYRELNGSWSSWATVKTTLTSGKFTCTDVILSLDNTKAFEFEIKATDKLDSGLATGSIDVGEAIFFISSNKKACYINGQKIIMYDSFNEGMNSIVLKDNTLLDTTSIAYGDRPLNDILSGITQDINRTDLDNHVDKFTAGYGHNLENTPSADLNLGHLISIPRHDAEGYTKQVFFPYSTNDIYLRSCEDGTWTEWRSLTEKNIMTVGIKENKNITISTTWSYSQLVCNEVQTRIGKKLTLENGAIKIGKGVKRVRVNANAMTNGIANHQIINIALNGTNKATGYYRGTATGSFGVVSLSPIILDVVEGDIIGLTYGAGATGTLVIAGGTCTYLTVEVID